MSNHNVTIHQQLDERWFRARCTCGYDGMERMRWQTALDDAQAHSAGSRHNFAVAEIA